MRPENSLLGRFHYLSTVSGGGYVGSWLSSWRSYDDFPKVWRELTSRPEGPDIEPPEISWLRAYSKYFTPRVDAVATSAIYSRYLLANWVVIVPFLCLALLILRIVVATLVGFARDQDSWWPFGVGAVVGVAALVVAQAFTTSHRPARREPQQETLKGDRPEASPRNIRQRTFITHGLAWSVLSALAFTLSLCSWWAIGWIDHNGRGVTLITFAIGGAFLFAAGWIAGRPVRRSWKDFALWVASGLVYGALVGLGAYLFAFLQPYAIRTDFKLSLPIIFGIPWVLMSQLFAEKVFVRLVSYQSDTESDRLWLDRGGSFVAAAATIWTVTAFLSIAVTHYIISQNQIALASSIAASLGGITGITTLVTSSEDKLALILKRVQTVAAPAFLIALVVGLSVALDLLLFDDSLLHALHAPTPTTSTIVLYLQAGAAVALIVGVITSKTININSFSLQGIYKTSLIRGYLGATRQA